MTMMTLYGVLGWKRDNYSYLIGRMLACKVMQDLAKVHLQAQQNLSYSSTQASCAICHSLQDGVTHTINTDKNYVMFSWTAPPRGTGDIRFQWAKNWYNNNNFNDNNPGWLISQYVCMLFDACILNATYTNFAKIFTTVGLPDCNRKMSLSSALRYKKLGNRRHNNYS